MNYLKVPYPITYDFEIYLECMHLSSMCHVYRLMCVMWPWHCVWPWKNSLYYYIWRMKITSYAILTARIQGQGQWINCFTFIMWHWICMHNEYHIWDIYIIFYRFFERISRAKWQISNKISTNFSSKVKVTNDILYL